MMRNILPLGALLGAVILVVGSLWAWQAAPDWVSDGQPERPEVMLWAVRSGAIAVAAFGQMIVLLWVIGPIYPRRPLDEGLRLAFAVTGVLAVVSAIALGLAGR